MSEIPGPDPERQVPHYELTTHLLIESLQGVEGITQDDLIFMAESLDFDEALGYAYGRLAEEGHDPDGVLRRAGIIE